MNHWCRLALVLLAAAGAALAGPGGEGDDKTLSPYFFVQSDDPTVDRLPLLSTTAEVDIAGVIADVRVTQVYKNDGKRPIEAVYTFPASTRAAVYGLKMTIGDRTIVAEIRERERARQDYEAARRDGKTATLLEQQRPNVFQMNVANIMPGDFIRVELSYTELLVPEEGVYEFVYPTVVGPRYVSPNVPKDERWTANPYTHEGEAPAYTFGIGVDIAAGMPIADLSCPSHKTLKAFGGLATASVRLDPSEKSGGNRDFILRYRLAGGAIESGLLLCEGARKGDENFFLLMLQPPKRVAIGDIPPREYIFIVDVSGSMHGFPLDVAKGLLRNLITGLRPTDYFNVLLFAGGSSVMAERSLAANEKNVARAVEFIDRQRGGGGTELLPALRRALALPRAEGTSRTVVIATDGYVSVETEAFDLIRENLGKANMFTFGIGSSVNRHLIEGMARVGMGEPFVVEAEAGASEAAARFRRYIERPVLTGIDVRFEGFDAYDVEPLEVPDLLSERPMVVFGKYRGKPRGIIAVTGRGGAGRYSEVVRVAEYAPRPANSALRYLWARHRIQLLADYNDLREDSARIREVTRLGLQYSLLTAYTSFVAIDSKVRNKDGDPTQVIQPLPLPQGVSNYAVGGSSGQAQTMAAPSAGYARGFSGRSMKYSAEQSYAEPSLPDADKPAGPPAVTLAEVKAGGREPGPVLRAELEGLLAQLESAYAAELAARPGLKGSLTVTFTIGLDGKATAVRVNSGSLPRALGQRLDTIVKRAVFAVGGTSVQVSARFEFSPGS
ncbi:MAG: VIT domain-containing protein [bacterium]